MQHPSEGAAFISHQPCPKCSSSDAFAVYSDGGGYCFSCGHYRRGDRDGDLNTSTTTRLPMVNYEGDFAPIRSRGLSEETCKKFNVRVETTEDGPVIKFPYYSQSGRIVAYKQRDKSKDFRWRGKNEDDQLFGQQIFGNGDKPKYGAKQIVITEGEMDALSVYQARPNWAVVSIPNGAQAARKALAKQLNYLMGFEEIILMFDNDEAGAQAVEECVTLFPPDRVFTANIAGYKDASEALQAKDGAAILQAIYKRSAYIPKSIVNAKDLFDLVKKPLHGKDADYPFDDLNKVTSGLRLRELVTITAGSGTGKSTLCGEIAQNLIDQGFTVGYIALEESLQRTALRMMTVKANKPLHLNNEIEDGLFRQAFDNSLGSDRLFLRDGFGSVEPDVILNDIRYLTKANNVQWVILDHLSILLSGNENSDERKMIDVTMTRLRSFVEETGIGLILISHLRRGHQDKGHEDGAAVSLTQLRGSHSIVQLSDMVIALQRNISAGDNKSDLVVLKNRFNGSTGPAGTLAYNPDTGRLQTCLDFSTDNPTTTDEVSYADF